MNLARFLDWLTADTLFVNKFGKWRGNSKFRLYNIFSHSVFLASKANGQTFGTDWFYGQENNWPNDKCRSGTKQSPIDIDPKTFDLEMSVMEPLIFHGYDQTPKSARLTNIGHTIEADFMFDKAAMLRDGGLPDEYKLDKIHFHWGTNGGSEHRIGSSVNNGRECKGSGAQKEEHRELKERQKRNF